MVVAIGLIGDPSPAPSRGLNRPLRIPAPGLVPAPNLALKMVLVQSKLIIYIFTGSGQYCISFKCLLWVSGVLQIYHPNLREP